jgi:glycosyltransferase involved in cell wall biosynthesis
LRCSGSFAEGRMAEDAFIGLTAIVGSHNESALLRRCLPSVAFCDEVIVIDIDSRDDTAAVAAAHGARVLRHAWVPIAERARMELVGEARHDWLLLLDPDEEVPAVLASQIRAVLPKLEPDVGIVNCPWQFYFRRTPLQGTVWGGIGKKGTVVHRDRVELRGTVHSGTRSKSGFRVAEIPFDGANAIAHQWAPTFGVLFEKHRRYLRLEGPDRYHNGHLTGLRDIATTPFASFAESFVRRAGYRDGMNGLALSAFWALYSTCAKVELLRELRRREKGSSSGE